MILAVLVQMRSTVHRFEIVEPVIERVAVLVMHDHPSCERSVRQLPGHNSTWTPHVRFGHFHPGPRVVPAARPTTYPYGAQGQPVACSDTPLELGAWRPSFTSASWHQVACALRRTGVRAVVHGQPLGGLAVERRPADRTGEFEAGTRPAQCRAISAAALRRAEQQAALVPCQPIWLDQHPPTATATRRFSHDAQYSGTGTTLAVATGHGRQATGIDIDPRNAELAQQRLGMFLDIIDTRESA